MPPSFDLIIAPSALRELNSFKSFMRRQIRDAIDQQLPFEPDKATRNRKMLSAEQADFDFTPPLWELRVGDHRIFYDIDLDAHTVYVRAIRIKPPHSTTDEVL
ncbi:MAG: type II toxin-antitoxin system RelE family toxin [Planctomycetaceae bacterium]